MMAEALIRSGHSVNRADDADWRINKSFVEHLAELAKAAMAEIKPKVVIGIGTEESYFMAQFEVGYTLPATKDSAGHHHINGELVVAGILRRSICSCWQWTLSGRLLVTLQLLW
jgi:hypothetical protein